MMFTIRTLTASTLLLTVATAYPSSFESAVLDVTGFSAGGAFTKMGLSTIEATDNNKCNSKFLYFVEQQSSLQSCLILNLPFFSSPPLT